LEDEYKKYLAKTMSNNHDYNTDCRGLQVLMIIVLSFPFMVAIATEAVIPAAVQTILLW
jgi:hypothetical protein